jgi:UDP-N-acetyl-D-glucosamine dehydrogenase
MPKQKYKNKSVAVIGLGYVGWPLAELASRKGYKVIGIDIDESRVRAIKEKESEIEATADFSKVKEVETIIICVPTPVFENHLPDLGPIQAACSAIAPHLKPGQLVILESTVNPGVSEDVVAPILERLSHLKVGKDFHLAHCPERINPGDNRWNVENIPRVLGSVDKVGLEKALEFYQSILTAEIRLMATIKEAEAVKVVENAFRDVNIAFVNELAKSFSLLGIDVVHVIEGASTKPFSFLPHYPGCGVGGHCIPVDPYYLIEHAKKNGFEHDFLSLARRINNQMPTFLADLVATTLTDQEISISGSKIAVLGLAYKPNIGDTRESPSFEIIRRLKMYGAEVVTYDPYVLAMSDVESLEEALTGAEAVVVATAHDLFRQMTPDYLVSYGVKVLVDGRNCLPKESFIEKGLTYKGVGR